VYPFKSFKSNKSPDREFFQFIVADVKNSGLFRYPLSEFRRAAFFATAEAFEQVLFGGDHQGFGVVGMKRAGAFQGFTALGQYNMFGYDSNKIGHRQQT